MNITNAIYNCIYRHQLTAEEIMKVQMRKTYDNLDGHIITFKRVENAQAHRMSRINLLYYIP